MEVFIDTSAFFAFIDEHDQNHAAAKQVWKQLSQSADLLITNNYVLVESLTLLQRRLGIKAVRLLQIQITPLLQIDWINEQGHTIAIGHLLTADRRSLSLVDCSGFETMQRLGIKTAWAFDPHFRQQGFDVIP